MKIHKCKSCNQIFHKKNIHICHDCKLCICDNHSYHVGIDESNSAITKNALSRFYCRDCAILKS